MHSDSQMEIYRFNIIAQTIVWIKEFAELPVESP